MEMLWDRGDATVRQVLEGMGGDLAYTTVMTVLDRLHGKGRVKRHKKGLAWSYRAAAPREAVIGEEAAALITGAGGEPEPLLMAFLDRTEATDPRVLDELERLIQKRRAARGEGR
jgi:predicted transcriptional regulator